MTIDATTLRHLVALLESRTGQQVAPSRMWRIETALKPVLRDRGIARFDDLLQALRDDSSLSDAVVDGLLNNETFFFRDAAAFSLLAEGALEQLRVARSGSQRLRIWSAGCSTGQEAYSLAIQFADAAARWADWTIEIVATDVSAAAIRRAQDGIFSQFEIQRGLPARAMLRWFDQDGEDWRIKRELARRIRFKQGNLLDCAPGGQRFDIVLCRNVLLYFAAAHRMLAFDRIADAIAPDGFLMLGAGETLIGQTDAFAPDTDLRGLYRPRDRARQSQAA